VDGYAVDELVGLARRAQRRPLSGARSISADIRDADLASLFAGTGLGARR
jgi:hypothetical protein